MHFCPKPVKTKNYYFITEEHEPLSLLDLDNTLNISGTSIPEVNNIKFLIISFHGFHIKTICTKNLNLQQAYLNASATIFLKPITNPCTMLFLRAIYLIA